MGQWSRARCWRRFLVWKRDCPGISALALIEIGTKILTGAGPPRQIVGARVSPLSFSPAQPAILIQRCLMSDPLDLRHTCRLRNKADASSVVKFREAYGLRRAGHARVR